MCGYTRALSSRRRARWPLKSASGIRPVTAVLRLDMNGASRPYGVTAPEHHQTNLGMITPNASRQADG